MDLRIDVYHHFPDAQPGTGGGGTESDYASVLDAINGKLGQVLATVTEMGATMSALSDQVNAAIDALQTRITDDVAALQQQVTDANQRALDAAANDAADAATIADLQSQVGASNADAQQIVDRINAIDPVTDLGVPPDDGGTTPPVDVPPDTTSPDDGTVIGPGTGQPVVNPGDIDPNTGMPVTPP